MSKVAKASRKSAKEKGSENTEINRADQIAAAIRELAEMKGIAVSESKGIIESTIKAAYKRTYGSCDNCIVEVGDGYDVKVYARKKIVDVAYSEVDEIEYDDSVLLDPDKNIGDYIDIPVDPTKFGRSAVDTGKQNAHQALNDTHKDYLYNMHKGKVGSLVSGTIQRETKGNVFVDLNLADVEGFLPGKNQSPVEVYEKNDRLSGLVIDIKKQNTGVQLVLSRADGKFVEKIFEREVAELADKTIGVQCVAREAGKKTKIAVYTNKPEVDPVGACVGIKGARITNVIHELMGEKIDVIRYDEDPHVFIKEALTPAKVKTVVLTDMEKREAIAIVPEDQFSFAIGKQGLNVRLANRLCNWNIDVKTESQAAEMDIVEDDNSRKAAESLFSDVGQEIEEQDEEIALISMLPGIEPRIAEILKNAGLDDIGDFVDAVENDKVKDIEGLSAEDIETVNRIIDENVEFEEEDDESADGEIEGQEEEEYFCPECGAKISINDTRCPKCGIELAFE
ncbi:MAG: transcription termination factor NusA [Treponema sp.]|nr:transcription termination factor NusA [Treponema sp.]